MHPVQLKGQLVRIRDFTLDDIDAAQAIVGDPRVTESLSFDARTREQTETMLRGVTERAILEPRTEYYLAVNVDEQLIGFVRLGLNGVQAAKLGYAIHADHWVKGYATDAARTMIGFGFGQLGLHRISAAIGPDNAGSIALSARLGFVYEGRIRDHVYTNSRWRDSLLYSVLAHEWASTE